MSWPWTVADFGSACVVWLFVAMPVIMETNGEGWQSWCDLPVLLRERLLCCGGLLSNRLVSAIHRVS